MRFLLLMFLPLFATAQTGWVNLEFQADNYGGESTWGIYMVGSDSVYVSGGPYPNNSYNEQLITLPPGEYNLVVNDAFGDGICCEFGEGWFGFENSCGISTYVYDFSATQITVPFNLLPCPPPVFGCTDEEANNYNPQAYFDGNNCLYDVTFRLDLNGPHPPSIQVPEINSNVNGWCGSCWAMQDDDADGVWELTVEMPEGQHLWKFSADNWEVQELPVGVLESPCFLFDEFGYVNRTINVEADMMLPPFCWESCLPCGAVPGCTNPNASNWSPWANFDNGSCTGLGADCEPWETEIVTTLILDNYPSETSFSIHNLTTDEEIIDISAGSLAEEVIGVPISFATCAATGSSLEVTLADTYGDGLGASQWGGQDGFAMVTACGDTLWSLNEADFGYNVVAGFSSPLCSDLEDVVGCGNPDYVEYNPDATVFVNLLCQTPKVYGCTDDSYFNYDASANTENTIDSCFYTLTITDGVGDGWFGSWLGIYQNGWTSPQYKMGPNDGDEEVFDVYLSSEEAIELFFFTTPQSQDQVDQCGFMLVGPTGDTLIDISQWNVTPFPNTYSVTPYCGNTCEPFVYGCTDSDAQNYAIDANTEDSSCYYAAGCTQAGYLEYYTQGYEADYDNGSCDIVAVFGCMDSTAFNYNEEANVETECTPVIIGCMNDLAYNYDPNANTEGECIPYTYGCTDPTAFNYNPDANADDGECIDPIYGCTDPNAFNYDPVANTDNDSCVEAVVDCMNPNAFNYNELANTPDEDACLYDAGCITGPGEPYWANDYCYSWVIEVDPYCCESEWDAVCVEQYEYCSNQVSSVDIAVQSLIHFYPNPTSRFVRVQAPVGTIITVVDASGRKIPFSDMRNIELPTPGVYVLIANYKGRIKRETIVRQ